jgi:hypothetical protein
MREGGDILVFVKEVVRDLFEIGKMGTEKGVSQRGKVGVLWVVDLDNSPRVSTDQSTKDISIESR